MVSRTGKYALRILGYLADRPQERVQGAEIAAATGIPRNYLSKVLNQLRKGRIVESQKGWGGGFRLRPRSGAIPISRVLELLEGRREMDECVFGLRKCDRTNPCPLHDRWERIRTEYDAMLLEITVGDLQSRR